MSLPLGEVWIEISVLIAICWPIGSLPLGEVWIEMLNRTFTLSPNLVTSLRGSVD